MSLKISLPIIVLFFIIILFFDSFLIESLCLFLTLIISSFLLIFNIYKNHINVKMALYLFLISLLIVNGPNILSFPFWNQNDSNDIIISFFDPSILLIFYNYCCSTFTYFYRNFIF